MRTLPFSRLACGCVASCLLCLTNDVFADTVTNTNDSGPGSLRQLLAAAGATIDFDPALNGQTIALTSGELLINRSVTIDATALANRVTLDAGTQSRVIFVNFPTSTPTATLRNLIITGGKTPDGSITTPDRDGGGIRARGGTLTLERCAIVNNATGVGGAGPVGPNGGFGGAIYSQDNSLTLTDCAIDNNHTGDSIGAGVAGRGGAIYLDGSGTLQMTRCSLSENATGNGTGAGGVGGSGGGILNDGHTVTIINSTLAGNICGNGTQSGNTLGGNGGAIFNNAGTINIQYSTVAGNSSGLSHGSGTLSRGGGIFNNGAASALTITNTIVANNAAPGTGDDIQGPYTASGQNIVEDDSQDPASGIVIHSDPSLGPLANNGGPTRTMRLLAGSIAVDLAAGASVATDQRGNSRSAFGEPDLGAYEAGAKSFVVNTLLDENDGIAAGAVSLRDAFDDGEAYSSISFDPDAFSGPNPTIELLHGELVLRDGCTVDASSLSKQVTLDAHGASGVIRKDGAVPALFENLVITGGVRDMGGGILQSRGLLTLVNCTVSGNSATDFGGGGIYSSSGLILTSSTVSGNAASGGGGGIYFSSGENLTLTNSTVSGNFATAVGGGIYAIGNHNPSLTLTNGTVSSNTAPSAAGIAVSTLTYTVSNSIVAGNLGGVSSSPTQLVGNNLLSGDPRLAPLGDYGGLTETMPSLPGSPAIDGAPGTSATIDQRGMIRPIDGDGNGSSLGDIGAVEFTPAADLARFWSLDFDGDKIQFGVEYALGLDPLSPDAGNSKKLTPPTFMGGQVKLTFGLNAAAASHTIWVLRRSTDLVQWQEAYRFDGPSMMHMPQPGFTAAFDNILNPTLFILTELNPPSRAFYRFEAVFVP